MNTSTSPTGAIDVDMSRGGFDEAIFKSIQEEVYPHRWKFTKGLNGTTIKTLQYYHRKARKWLDCKDENGCKVTSILEGR